MQNSRRGTKRILIVEDDGDTRAALAEFLAQEHYEVSCASDGAEALALLRTAARPDLILLDLMLPNMDGWDFRAAQRQHPSLSGIPVIALSAVGRLADAETIRKPVNVEELLERLRSHLGPVEEPPRQRSRARSQS